MATTTATEHLTPAVLLLTEAASPAAPADTTTTCSTTSPTPPPPPPPPLASLKFALENAFAQLNNDEFEAECAIEQSRRQLPFVHALRNAFLHLQEPEFESVIASERERRRNLEESNRKKYSILADCHAKVRTAVAVTSRKSAAANDENGIATATTADTDDDDDDDDDVEAADRDDANEVAASRTSGDAPGAPTQPPRGSIKKKNKKKRGPPLSSDDSSNDPPVPVGKDKKKKHKKDSSSNSAAAPYSAIVAGHYRPRLFNKHNKNNASADVGFDKNNKNSASAAAAPYSAIVSRAATSLLDAATTPSSSLLLLNRQHPPLTSVSPDAVPNTTTTAALLAATAALNAAPPLPAPPPPQWRMVWMPSPISHQPCIQQRVSLPPSMTNNDAEKAMSLAATAMLSMVGQAPTTAATTTTTTTMGRSSEKQACSKKSGQQTTLGGGVFGWTKVEDMQLTDIMKKYKNPSNWESIAKQLGRNRTARECHERWIRYLKPGFRKGQWTAEEDAIVMNAVMESKEQPFARWSDLAEHIPGRVGKQIRDRWINHLNPDINHLPFSRDDDLLLWTAHETIGKRWVEIAATFFKSTRSENQIKNRWHSAAFKQVIADEFGPQVYPSGPSKSSSSSSDQSCSIAAVVSTEGPTTLTV